MGLKTRLGVVWIDLARVGLKAVLGVVGINNGKLWVVQGSA